MSTNELEILGHILIAAAKTENSHYPFIIDVDLLQGDATFTRSWNGIVKDCKRIAHNIPQPIRDIVGKHIQTRRDSNPASRLPESFCQPDSPIAQISQTPREVSQSISEEATVGSEPNSREEYFKAKTASAPILLKDLKSWVESPKQFLNLEGIKVDDCGIIPYIRAVENSQYLNTIRKRFVLRQLAESKRLWAPRTTKTFFEKLATPRSTLNNWIYEGGNYASLVANKGPEVLFSELKPRTQKSKKKAPPQGKKRSIDDLITGGNIETDVRNHHAKEANNPSLTFTHEELQLPKVYLADETGEAVEAVEVDENGVPIQELFKAAAKGIVTFLEDLHRQAGLLDDDEPQDSRSATYSCQSGYCSCRATNDDTMVDAGRSLRQSPTKRATDDGISSCGFGCTSTNSTASLPGEQVAIRGLQEHTSWNATGLPSPSLVEPGQEGTSSVSASKQSAGFWASCRHLKLAQPWNCHCIGFDVYFLHIAMLCLAISTLEWLFEFAV
ncbi:hypothetical protein Forpi1262_v017183 [Fusarium oxysporum f. sp. raphani]|uniref:Uncharacterized protein n=1 Tax=Fusarium oxysporum f. sp. raphani TaxID=96318 RepID=A0A8J5U8R0_FUSOX|nr:hypothetical protein Forpi1262_v017183 [Fusarium oxysporum f. sp. raphani]